MYKQLKRIVPTDVLRGNDLAQLMDLYQADRESMASDDESDPAHPETLSPQSLVRPDTRFVAPVAAAAVVAATAKKSGWLPEWLSWKMIALGVLIAFVLFVLIRYWQMAKTLGFKYAFAAALPPLRLVLAPMTGTTSDNMLAEIESFNLGVHPKQIPPLPPPPPPPAVPKQSPPVKPKVEESPKPKPKEVSKDEIIDDFVAQATEQQDGSVRSSKAGGVLPADERQDALQLPHYE